MKSKVLFESDNHQWVVFGRDKDKDPKIIDTNQYAIISKNNAFLVDPGGIDIFPSYLAQLIKYVKTDNIVGMLGSHQDPDIISSLPMWLDLNPNIVTYCSWMWEGFISHFAMGHSETLHALPDEGATVQIGTSGRELQIIPAHYCHSSGNYSLYDPKAKILFSGDIGAALLPDADAGMFVENFEKHIQYMEAFHVRWMPSSQALKSWVSRVREIRPKMICPQHGAIFEGENVNKFLNWLETLQVGRL